MGSRGRRPSVFFEEMSTVEIRLDIHELLPRILLLNLEQLSKKR